MNEEIEKSVKAHYQLREIPGSRLDEILRFCEPAHQVSCWRRLAFVGFSAAAVAICALLIVFATHASNSAGPPVVRQDNVAAKKNNKNTTAVDRHLPAHEPARIQLIAVKIHADPCGRCKTIAPVFADLQTDFSDKPVLFLTFDLTTKGSRRQAELLSQRLGIEGVFKKHRYTGVIVLVTVEGDVREVVDSSTKFAMAKQSLARNLNIR